MQIFKYRIEILLREKITESRKKTIPKYQAHHSIFEKFKFVITVVGE